MPRRDEMLFHLRNLEPSERGTVFLLLWLNAVVVVAGQLGCAVAAVAVVRRAWRAREQGLPTALQMARPTPLCVTVLGVIAYRLWVRWAVRRWFSAAVRRADG